MREHECRKHHVLTMGTLFGSQIVLSMHINMGKENSRGTKVDYF